MKTMSIIRICLFFCLFVLYLPSYGFSLFTNCSNNEDKLVVNTFSQHLTVCDHGSAVTEFPVALGHSGVGKHHAGDGKTPVGTYGLGHAHFSNQFGLFIPVLYPNPWQRREGYSGSGVGIHGPPRIYKNAGILSTQMNWTNGCIALPSDHAVAEIAQWLHQHPRAIITIET